MINLKNDYLGICHPEILKALSENLDNTYDGYGYDDESNAAKDIIKHEIGNLNADVYFTIGGTSTNKIVISHALKNYEAVIAPNTGHISTHEVGTIEQGGHKVIECASHEGKIDLASLQEIIRNHSGIHMVQPKMVYISNTTEFGTVYTKKELDAIATICRNNNLYLYIDGARLGSALTSKKCDYDIKYIASIADIFYIGGTKNGAMLGEAIVICNSSLKEGFPLSIKQNGGLLAKGFINGIAFRRLFTNNLFYTIAKEENKCAEKLSAGIEKLGYQLAIPTESNQIFIMLSHNKVKLLSKKVLFEIWEDKKDVMVIRLVTSYMTKEEDIFLCLQYLKEIGE